MFKAFGRMVKSLLYIVTFQFNKISDVWGSSPGAIAARYDEIKAKHTAGIHQVKKAVASLMTAQNRKQRRLEDLTADITKHQNLMDGAQGMAKKTVLRLQQSGADPSAIKADPEYVRCSNAFSDFKSTLAAKEVEAQEVASEIETNQTQLDEYGVQLQDMVRELKTIEEEKGSTIADVEIAKQQKEANDLRAGISQSGTNEDRARLQDMRARMKNEATISRTLAGADANKAEQDFLEYAQASEASTEFDDLLGLGAPTETAPKAITDQTDDQATFEVEKEKEKVQVQSSDG